MYSLMLVDDEVDVRKAILETMDWQALGFAVVGEADNGRDALELAERLAPDVIITDIRMPFMDGIEFVRALREQNPVTKVIFLTGFNDFEYAQSAIQCNVMEYLLKPISAENLEKTLTSVREKLDREQAELRDIEKLRQNFYSDRLIVRMGFLHALIMVPLTQEHVEDAVHKLELHLTGETQLLFITRPSRHSLRENSVGIDDTDILLRSISALVSQTADRYLQNESFWYLDQIVTILSDAKEKIEEQAQLLMREVQQALSYFYGVSCTIGVSERFADMRACRAAYQSALSALGYRAVLGGGRIIHISDIEPSKQAGPIYNELDEAQLQTILKTGTREQISAFIGALFGDLSRRRAAVSDYQMCVVEVFSVVIRTAKSLIPDFELNVGHNLGLITDIFSHETIDEIREWLERLCWRVIEYIGLQRQDSADILARSGYDYMKENYADSTLSLKSVSEQLHISSSYFSAIFKKAIGDSFTNVLIKIRMEHAHELLLSTNKKILEIAQQTGYPDQHYFSYCFKKYFQISPNEMRRASQTGA